MTIAGVASVLNLQTVSGSNGDFAEVAGYRNPGDLGGGSFYLATILTVIGATNTSPIVVTTDEPHGLMNGQKVHIENVGGNINANGDRIVTVLTATTFSLDGPGGSGAYTSGGTATIIPPSARITNAVGVTASISAATNATPIEITTTAAHGYVTGQIVVVSGVGGNTAANGSWTITCKKDEDTKFTLDGSDGTTSGAYTSGGTSNTVTVTTAGKHGLSSRHLVIITRVGGNTVVNGTWECTVLTNTTFSIGITTGGAYTSGGLISDGGLVVASSAKNGYWQRIHSGSIEASWFGCTGDGLTDDSLAIQTAIDVAIRTSAGRVRLPPGICLVSRTIQLGRHNDYSSVVLEGDGYKYSNNFCGTAIQATQSDSPCINIQGARGSVLRGIKLLGPNVKWIEDNDLGLPVRRSWTLDDTAVNTWWDTALTKGNTRYSPCAGISIDGWSWDLKLPPPPPPPPAPPTPPPPPPTPPPNPYPTRYMAYGQKFSSDVLIEDCQIQGFNVGIVNQPCDADSNADFTLIRRVNIDSCVYGISVGNTQSRQVGIQDVKIAKVYCCLTNNVHGRQSGKFNGTIDNLSFGACIHLFQFGSSAYFGPLKFVSCYGESVWRLGDIAATTSNETSISFDECVFAFHNQVNQRGIPATVLGGLSQQIVIQFNGGFMGNYPSCLTFFQEGIVFNGTTFAPESRLTEAKNEYIAMFHNATAGGVIFPFLRTSEQHKIKFYQATLDPPQSPPPPPLLPPPPPPTTWKFPVSAVLACNGMKSTDRTKCIPAWVQTVAAKEDDSRDFLARPLSSTAIAKVSGKIKSIDLAHSSTSPGILTVKFHSLPTYEAEVYGHCPGDCILDDNTGMVFAIRSLGVDTDGTTPMILAEAQNNYKSTSTAYTICTKFEKDVGNFYFLNCRMYTPTNPVLADLTVGSGILTNVGRADGYATFLTTDIVAGDRIVQSEHKDKFIAYPNSGITDVKADTQTITLAGNILQGSLPATAVTVAIPDVSTADTVYVAAPCAGTITKVYSVLGGPITGADANLSTKIGGTAITNGTWVVANSGSAAGDLDSCSPTKDNTVAAGSVLSVSTDGASSTAARLTVTFVIHETNAIPRRRLGFFYRKPAANRSER